VTGTEQIHELRAQVARQREAIERLEEERRRLAELLIELPTLFATNEPDALVAGFSSAARSMTDATFGLFVPADGDHVQTLVGLQWSDFAEAPAPGMAPLLAVGRGDAVRTIDDVTRWMPSAAATGLYGVLSDGRLVRSWLIVPVRGRSEELHGVLYLGHSRPRAFGPHHEQQLQVLGSTLGIALDAVLLTAERERMLLALESSLLPPLLPSIPGMDLAARYRPADDAALVGGDFYDVFRSGERRWSVVIGDVCGAGAEAAAITGVPRYGRRAPAPERRPPDTLERLNAALDVHHADPRFLTAVLADIVIEPAGLEITLAIAGHPPPVVLRDDGSTELLDHPHGVLLGVMPTIDAVDVPVVLDPGDALVLYTDGVIEARDKDHEQFGVERLVELVGTCAGRTAIGVARRVELAVVSHAGGTVDDIAILVLRRAPRPDGSANPRD